MSKVLFVSILFFLSITIICGQSQKYIDFIAKAENAFLVKDYKSATIAYTNAFWSIGGKGQQSDRYKAAIAWALLGNKDSAFFNLNRLLQKTDFLETKMLISEPNFYNLHTDLRWQTILTTLNPNGEKYKDSLAIVLATISDEDQKYRVSQEVFKANKATAAAQDSINLLKVTQILEKYGWLSANEVGNKGNTALWLVIQHAPLSTMEKYLPVLQNAVERGKTSKKHLAYLQDRVLMWQGKKQIYGTQYKLDKQTNEMKLWDLDDSQNVNKRRESVGLPPL